MSLGSYHVSVACYVVSKWQTVANRELAMGLTVISAMISQCFQLEEPVKKNGY